MRFILEHAPRARAIFHQVFVDLLFVPHLVAKQMALALVLETGRFCVSQSYYKLYQGFLVRIVSSRARMMHRLELALVQATSQHEFTLLAEQIDALTQDYNASRNSSSSTEDGDATIKTNQDWRMEPKCALYEHDRIKNTMDHYLHLMRRGQVFDLLFVLRGNLGRNQFGLLHKGLFSKARAGTKVLVETYHNVVCAALEFVCDYNPPTPNRSLSNRNGHPMNHNYHNDAEADDDDENNIPTEARLAFFNEVRHAYGRSSLLLSGGAACKSIFFSMGSHIKTSYTLCVVSGLMDVCIITHNR